MSWFTAARDLMVRWGKPARFAVKHVIAAVVPGGSLVADAVARVLDCAQDTAVDQKVAETLARQQVSEEALLQIGGILEECNGQLAALTEQLAHLDGLPEAAERMIRLQRTSDERVKAGFANLARFAERFDHLQAGVDNANAKLDTLLDELREFVKRNHVRPGAVSVTDERERAVLRRLRDEYRKRPPAQQNVESMMLLADSLSAAGQYEPAKELHARAAGRAAAENSNRAAEAYYKAYLDACELRQWQPALKALLEAARLDPARYRPFPTDEYVPDEILGAGGFGTVVKCKYLYADEANPYVAVKTLHTADLARDVQKVFAEAHTMKTLRHPAIIGVHYWNYADEAKTRPFIVMEFFDGVSLAAHLRRHGKLAPADVVAIARQIAAAMKEAHAAKVYHRDLKPDNILVRKTDRGWEVRLIDFGLAVRQQAVGKSMSCPPDARSARDRSYAGTFKYAPPEQKGERDHLSGKIEPVDTYSDVYTFGKTVCEALFGTTEAKSFHYDKLPKDFQSLRPLLERCTADAVQERVPDFGTILEALQAIHPPTVKMKQSEAEEAARKRREQEEDARRAEEARRDEEDAWKKRKAEQEEWKRRKQEEARKKDETEEEARQRRELPKELTVNPTGLKMRLIPAGAFLMGAPKSEANSHENERPQHKVSISKAFYLGTDPVTVGQFRAFVQASGYKTEAEREGTGAYGWTGSKWEMDPRFNWQTPGWKQEHDMPVVCVSWNDATAFCAWLSKQSKKEFRLPTEAEWEYACRAGTKTSFWWGASMSAKQANFDGNYPYGGADKGDYLQKTTRVGSYNNPNPWGLYDVHGNVWEWCQDWYDAAFYSNCDKKDPVNVKIGTGRVLRGGSWGNNGWYCRAAFRYWVAPGYRGGSRGFRVGLTLPPGLG